MLLLTRLSTKEIECQAGPEESEFSVIKGYLVHLSFNMWCDRDATELTRVQGMGREIIYQSYLRCDDRTWDWLVDRLHEARFNLVLIDLGDAYAARVIRKSRFAARGR